MCIKTFNITEEQSEFIKNNGEILHVSQSQMLRKLLDEAMNPKKEKEIPL
jgi:translation initiation factor 2B subunit (eIF-2B alpha/beta/delta family)